MLVSERSAPTLARRGEGPVGERDGSYVRRAQAGREVSPKQVSRR